MISYSIVDFNSKEVIIANIIDRESADIKQTQDVIRDVSIKDQCTNTARVGKMVRAANNMMLGSLNELISKHRNRTRKK